MARRAAKGAGLAIAVMVFAIAGSSAQPPGPPGGFPGGPPPGGPGGPPPGLPPEFAARMAKQMAAVGEARKAPTPRMADGKPDLNGLWGSQGMDLGPGTVKGGDVVFAFPDYGKGGRMPMPTNGPRYKPELVAKVDYNDANEPVTDKVFKCGRAGVPRIGAPQQIIQTANQIVFLYVDVAGQTFRVIPTDGRAFREDADETYNGDAVGHWDGDTLIVDTKNFVDDTWFGERGYFHTSQMTVQERLKREGNVLTWVATITDPGVLQEPWTTPPRMVIASTGPLDEPPPCNDIVSDHLVNHDNHQQR